MPTSRPKTTSLLLAIALLMSCLMVSVHHHGIASAKSEKVADVIAPVCACAFHIQELPVDETSLPVEDHEDCQVCQLLAEFQFEMPFAIEFQFDSVTHSVLEVEISKARFTAVLSYQVRGPPVV